VEFPKKAIALSLMSLIAVWCARAESEQPEYIEIDGENDDWVYCPDHVTRSYGDNIYNFRSMDVFYLGPSVVSTNADFCGCGEASVGLKAIWKATAATFAPVANVYVPCGNQV